MVLLIVTILIIAFLLFFSMQRNRNFHRGFSRRREFRPSWRW